MSTPNPTGHPRGRTDYPASLLQAAAAIYGRELLNELAISQSSTGERRASGPRK